MHTLLKFAQEIDDGEISCVNFELPQTGSKEGVETSKLTLRTSHLSETQTPALLSDTRASLILDILTPTLFFFEAVLTNVES